jgi:Ca2+-binding RTX toxin-like protein
MAWKFPLSTNTGLSLGTADNVYVAQGILVAKEGNQAISGTGTDHHLEIYGTVISPLDCVVLAAAGSSSLTSDIYVGSTGHVITMSTGGGSAIAINGAGASIENDGEIRSLSYGILVISYSNAKLTTIVNDGTISGSQYGICLRTDATGLTKVTNTGSMSGDVAIGSDNVPSVGADTIINKGSIIGKVILDGGDDTYDGRSGSIKGDIFGGGGADTILGGKEKNTFFGDAGADRLQGGLGADKLTGGADGDLFIFKAVAESTVASSGRDTILDFSHAAGDVIDLHSIDAKTTKSGDQAFTFIDSQTFHGVEGELRFQKSSTDTFVYGDVNGDGKADFGIKLTGLISLAASDFIL